MVDKSTTPIGLMTGVESPAMSDHLVRLERLRQLQRERDWNDSELARQCKRLPQQIRSWADPKGRKIGERLARALEEELKLPRYWLDERPHLQDRLEGREGTGAYSAIQFDDRQPATQEGTDVPVIHWDQLSAMFHQLSQHLPAGTPVLSTFAPVSSTSKFVQMPDDSMAPTFSLGDHILFEPAEAPRAGDTVLIRIATGEYFVRTFRPRTAHHWVGEPINGNYEPITSTKDDALVVAVMVEHRRYRNRNS